jgi:predicted RNA-binding Zn-ribbon protein involved in translation (DUF1610 family)
MRILNPYTKLELIQEMPWIADTTCPHCGITFDADARVETWPYNTPDLKKIIRMYMKTFLYGLDCPECTKPMIHDAKKHKIYKYDPLTLKKIPPVVQKFLKDTKPHLSSTVKDQYDKNFNMKEIYNLKEKMTFKEFCKVYDSLH